MPDQPGIVLVHAAWHNADSWRPVLTRSQARGVVAEALDLPGAGAHARHPVSYTERPLDLEAFAAEISPNATVSQDERTAAVLLVVEEVAARTGRPVVVVGHSLGGITVSSLVEAHPELVAAAVYLAAFMLPPGMAVIDLIRSPAMAQSLTPQLFLADPEVVGALRLDPRSSDDAHLALIKDNFYNDVDDAVFTAALIGLHPDEPIGVFLQPSGITPERFGTVERHYVRTTEDHTIVPMAQEQMIAQVDATMPHPTYQYVLNTSHSPFASQPDPLTDLFTTIATGPADN